MTHGVAVDRLSDGSKRNGSANQPSANTAAKLDCLQVLRGVAAAMVVLYHTGTLFAVHTGHLLWGNVFRAGFSGVEVFFVLSGLVIFWVHGSDIGRPERARSFVFRRGFRLLPVYFVVVALKALKDPSAVALSTLLAALLLLPAYPPFVNVSWTLSYELFFYGMFLLWILLPKGRWSVLPMGVMLLLALLPAPQVPAGSVLHDWLRFLFNPHLLAFIFGVAVGWLLRRFGPAPSGLAFALTAAGLLAFVGAAWWGTHLSIQAMGNPSRSAYELAELQSNWVFDAGVLCFALPAALLIGGLLSLELRGLLRIPLRRPLAWLGDISYSLYLTHGFVIHLFLSRVEFRAWAVTSPAILALVWAAALLLAWLFYRLVEVPSIRLGRHFSSKRSAAS
jgi:exopolysaccharide production protein ExoZ